MQVFSNGHVEISRAGQIIATDHHTLAALNAFSQPISLAAALEALHSRIKSAQDWIELTSTIVHLYEGGILQDAERAVPVLRAAESGFDAASIHIKMLNDRARTEGYLAGIKEVVRPGDVVVDVGTGTGVLALAAARAGARHVYAIEASAIGRVAEAVFEANGLSDRITLMPGWSTQVSLPERADVLISEIIGNEPLGEQVLEVTSDALKRLTKPNARMVPGAVTIYGLPVTVPHEVVAKHFFTEDAVKSWRRRYGLDFSPLVQKTQSAAPYQFFISPHRASDWTTLSEPVRLADIDLKTVHRPQIATTAEAVAQNAGTLNGLLIYFELRLGPRSRISTHPAEADDRCSWHDAVWITRAPLTLVPGDRFSITYTHRTTRRHTSVSLMHA